MDPLSTHAGIKSTHVWIWTINQSSTGKSFKVLMQHHGTCIIKSENMRWCGTQAITRALDLASSNHHQVYIPWWLKVPRSSSNYPIKLSIKTLSFHIVELSSSKHGSININHQNAELSSSKWSKKHGRILSIRTLGFGSSNTRRTSTRGFQLLNDVHLDSGPHALISIVKAVAATNSRIGRVK